MARKPAATAGSGEPPPRWLVVTDLDGTLLDDGYDLAAAAAAIDRFTDRGVVVALASSKTRDELLALARLCARAPVLIFENGAGIGWPQPAAWESGAQPYRFDVAGSGYPALRARLRALRRRTGYHFLGFGDLSPREVAAHTGLSEDGARLARHRSASEPILWLDSADSLSAFRDHVAAAGLRLVEGGRFHHVMPCTDKACGLSRVAERLAADGGERCRTVACGDAENDLAMLQAADHALVFPGRDGGYLAVPDAAGRDVAVRAAGPGGPACWSETLERLLSDPAAGRPARPRRRLLRSLAHE